MIVLRLRENQRGVRFRLGRVTGVVGPGWVWLLPWLDRLQVVDLDQAILGWRGYSREELERRLLALVLDTSRVGDRRPDSSPASVSKPETRSRATSAGIGWWLFHGLLLALGWLLLFAGGLAIRGKTAPPPLSRQSDYQTGLDIAGGMILLLVGLAVVVRGFPITMWRQHQLAGLQRQYPDAPWLWWNPQWRRGRIEHRPGWGRPILFLILGLLWGTVLYIGYDLTKDDILSGTEGLAAQLLLIVFWLIPASMPFFYAIGALLARRYGATSLHLDSLPVPIGGQLRGTIRTSFPRVPSQGFQLELYCLKRIAREDLDLDDASWQQSRHLPASYASQGASGVQIPVLFDIPAGAAETQSPISQNRTAWYLRITTDRRDAHYECLFEIPVFRLSLSPGDKTGYSGAAAR